MAKAMSFRLDDVHVALLDRMVEVMLLNGVKTNKTDAVQKSIYYYAKEVLSDEEISEIIDKYYKGIYQDVRLADLFSDKSRSEDEPNQFGR